MPRKHSSWFFSSKVSEVWSSRCVDLSMISLQDTSKMAEVRQERGVENAHPSRSPLALHLGVTKTLGSKSEMTQRKES